MGTLMNALNKSDFCYISIAIIPGELGQESTGQGEFCTNIKIYLIKLCNFKELEPM